ncbi:MAG TPA: hypothetical protein VKE27_02060 [Candidatus Dormibacteraeota bacterium]|nr:hypothetical protein [Candidatus Dormibacteraeota bacterium]
MPRVTARRFALVVSVLLTGSLAFAASAQAAPGVVQAKGGSAFLVAGSYDFTSLRASLNLFGDPSQPEIGLFVTGGPNVSRPLGGPSSTTNSVSMFFNISSPSGPDGGGCVVLDNPADFTVASDVSSASLHTTVTDTTQLCGAPINLPLPVQIDITWTGSGPIEATHDVSTFRCTGYTDETQTSDTSNNANATASFGTLAGSFSTTQAGLGIRTQTIHAQGATPPDSCAGGVGGKGAGRGLQPAGNYVFNRTEFDTNLFPTDPSSPQLFLTTSANTDTSNPLGGPSTSGGETDLVLFINSSTANGFGCFVIDASDFNVAADLSTVTLHTTLTTYTPACQGGSNSLNPLPLTIDVTWAGSGPVATSADDGQVACGSYHMQSSSSQTINNGGSSTISISGVTGPVIGNGTAGSNTTRVHADGVAIPACTFRG